MKHCCDCYNKILFLSLRIMLFFEKNVKKNNYKKIKINKNNNKKNNINKSSVK